MLSQGLDRIIEGYMKQKNSNTVFIAPAYITMSILMIVPLLLLVVFSLTSWNLMQLGSFKFFGFGNIRRMISDPRFFNSVKVSFYYIFFNTLIQVVLGTIVALLLFQEKLGTKVLRPLFLFPMLLPPVCVGVAWKVLFVPSLGGINYFLKALFNITGPDWFNGATSALAAVTIASVWEWTPFVMLLVLAGLEALPKSPFESASIDGANYFQILTKITLPLLKPVFMTVIMLRIIESLAILPLIFMMTGGGPANATEPINVYAYYTGLDFLDVSYASTLMITFIFILLICSVAFVKPTLQGAGE